MKQGSYSVGALYLTICNNPRAKRFLREETFLLAILPGPSEPSLEDLNNVLEIFVPDLKRLYEGMCRTSAACSNTNVTHLGITMSTDEAGVEAVINALLQTNTSDLPASRKSAGLASHSTKQFMCTVCPTPFHSLGVPECFDATSKHLLIWYDVCLQVIFRCGTPGGGSLP